MSEMKSRVCLTGFVLVKGEFVWERSKNLKITRLFWGSDFSAKHISEYFNFFFRSLLQFRTGYQNQQLLRRLKLFIFWHLFHRRKKLRMNHSLLNRCISQKKKHTLFTISLKYCNGFVVSAVPNSSRCKILYIFKMECILTE